MNLKKTFFLMVAMVLSCLPLVTSALSLGDLHAFSRQNERLEAEVKLVSFNPKTRLEQINVSIPPLAMFKRFNLRRHAILDRIRSTSVQTKDGFLVRLVSTDAMPSEPVDLLIEVEIDGERTLKQYRLALPTKRAALPLKQAKPLPVPVPANILGKKVPQHVDFGKQQNTGKQAARPVAPTKKTLTRTPRSLPVPVAKKVNAGRVSEVANNHTRQQNPIHQLNRKTPKQAIGQPVQAREQKAVQVAQQVNQAAGVAHFAHAETSAADTEETIIYENWQSEQDYYREYQLQPTPMRATHYTVKRGDTLSKIAALNKPAGVNTDQMLFALFKQNSVQLPTIEKIDKLYIGQRLKLPTPDEARAISRLQGSQFKQSYLEKYRQRQAKKRQAAEKARLSKVRKEKAKQATKLVQTVTRQPQSAAINKTRGTAQPLPVTAPVTLPDKAAASLAQQTAVNAVQILKNDVAVPPNSKVIQLEGRLRKVKRLLEIEKQQHATTKKVVKEKNRLIQRKDSVIQNLQVAGVKGNKAENDTSVSPDSTATHMNQIHAASMEVDAQTFTVADDVKSLQADEADGLTALRSATWPVIKDSIAQYPVLSILLPVIALLGLLALLFKTGRKNDTHSSAIDDAEHDPLHTAEVVEPTVDYSPTPQHQPQKNPPPGHASAYVSSQSAFHNTPSTEAPSSGNHIATEATEQVRQMAVTPTPSGNDAVSMSGHGPQTVVINISAPAKLTIDMAVESQQLDILRQQTDKLKESLRSLENSSRMLSRLSHSEVGTQQQT